MTRQVGSVLWPALRALQVYGANTGVGKTIFSTILCRAFARELPNVYYFKPVSTGPLDEADDRHISSFAQRIISKCLYQFDDPVSPHIAARSSAHDVSDVAIQSAVRDALQEYADQQSEGIAIVETAGGVLSPAPSGSSQADLYRALRLPAFLVGDPKLGGIGTTISAWESLYIRGYDVQSVALFQNTRYENHSYLKEYFADRDVDVFSIAEPPEFRANREEDAKAMQSYYDDGSQEDGVSKFVHKFLREHDQRIQDIRKMPAEAEESIWHPFAQHKQLTKDKIVAIDSAYGDFFQTYSTKQDATSEDRAKSVITPAFDGSASWWTQGLGHGNPRLALTAAHAAGRYGHVMFANAVHQPALSLAQTLINKMGNERLAKVFYTDNGSTGMEVAVKMALRAASVRHGWSAEEEVSILGLTNSYHGDTIGTMDCSEPSIFNKKVEWYRGRGFWFDFPQVKMRKGKWIVEAPAGTSESLGETREFASLDQIFDFDSRQHDRQLYQSLFDAELSRLRSEGKKFGALILEPILLGAGGMMFADPLFQRCLVEAVRRQPDSTTANGKEELDWRGMPVIFDEVFTGLYRLGRFSAGSFLGIDPDIVVNAKLLTGGLLPLCTTTASQSIFDVFLSDDKSDALLHGHSYTAHAVGCEVANESLKTMMKLEQDGSWSDFRSDWNIEQASSSSDQQAGAWSMWSQSFVRSVSHKEHVDSVFAIGSVLAISLKDPAGAGYASMASAGLQERLLADPKSSTEAEKWLVHSRVLGNVLYLMAAPTTSSATLKAIEEKVLENLH